MGPLQSLGARRSGFPPCSIRRNSPDHHSYAITPFHPRFSLAHASPRALHRVASATAFSAALKPKPSGIYDLLFGAPGTGRVELTGNPLLTNPNIDGFRFKVGWAKIQPNNADEYKWDQIDAAIALAAANGKKMCLSIAAGFSTPAWVYTTAPVVYKYNMLEIDRNTGVSIGSQPLPWDTAYQAKWAKFLAAFGARYESNSLCSYIVISGFMQTSTPSSPGQRKIPTQWTSSQKIRRPAIPA